MGGGEGDPREKEEVTQETDACLRKEFLTLSKSKKNDSSQQWEPVAFQLVCPASELSNFKTAQISPDFKTKQL